jgi:Peptidase_C39 like family
MKRNLILVSSVLVIVLLVGIFLVAPHLHTLYAVVRWDMVGYLTYIHDAIYPVGVMPTPLPQPQISHHPLPTPTGQADDGPALASTPTAQASAAPPPTPNPTPTLPPLPDHASVAAPALEHQDANNCGPATLAMDLRFFGWQGNQYDISKVIKPDIDDRNVNVDELIFFVRNHAGWLNADYRVGGTLDILKRFIANGMPIMIEEGEHLNEVYWPGDDHWAGHYLLLTAYDDSAHTFTSQDSWYGANLPVNYDTLNQNWQMFNRAFIFLYTSDQAAAVQTLLGSNWDEDANRTFALNTAQYEAQTNPSNAFAWFNVGTNLLYFDRYNDAAAAYDTARKIGLPQRMLRYQFGPFIAYFKTNRNADLLAITEYALKITPNSEEDLLWHGWALYRKGESTLAMQEFQLALKYHPGYIDAQSALDFVAHN